MCCVLLDAVLQSDCPVLYMEPLLFKIAMWLVALVVLAVVTYVWTWMRQTYGHWHRLGVAHASPRPFVGALGGLVAQTRPISDITTSMYEEARRRGLRYFGFYEFLRPVLLLCDPDLIKRIMVQDFQHFTDHVQFVDKDIDPLFARNLFSMRGTEWKRMRNTLSPAFTGSKMRLLHPLLERCAYRLTQYLRCKAEEAGSEPLALEMKDLCTRYTADVIASATFGYQCDSMAQPENKFFTMARKASDFTGVTLLKFFGVSFSPALMKFFKIKLFSDDVSEYFRNIVTETIASREQSNHVRPDMIQLLMEARRNQSKTESISNDDITTQQTTELSYDDITAQAVLFFVAGFDTSSTLMMYIMYELAVNPGVQETLRSEVEREMADTAVCSYEIMHRMKYLDMTVNETLRKWPPGIIGDRMCVQPYLLEPAGENCPEVQLAPGNVLWVPTFAIHRDPQYYPEPEKFDPERFNDENKKNRNAGTYLPFGIGPRFCIGSRFVLMETKVLIVHLVREFDLVPVEKTAVPPQLCASSMNLNVRGGMWIGLVPRPRQVDEQPV